MSGARYEAVGRTATITIDRPPANALSVELLHELDSLVSRAEVSGEVACLVITGAGDRFFCAGADVREAAATPPARAGVRTTLGQRLMKRLERLPIPVVAAINGACMGGGCELAMAADLRVASETARFAQPEVKLGIIPGLGGTQRLPRLVGRGRALELLLTGTEIDAREAHRIGLVNRVVAPEQLAAEATALAAELAAQPGEAIAAIKHTVRDGLEGSLEAGLDGERAAAIAIRSTADAQEGLAAFTEKRPPRYGTREGSEPCR